ncbi:MAG: EscU/YscU/HrcU family type III secretion system export apparatus switch protein, partial [Alphaproteobacteria bacterium]|nr:EscU/YscU/HrcU family type III secretion system export apparatus switch protein [Alphaproteobacteria bacterium]
MSEDKGDDDSDDKTEEPSSRKLEKAKEEGNVVFSKEIITFCMIMSSAICILYVLPWSVKTMLTDSLVF